MLKFKTVNYISVAILLVFIFMKIPTVYWFMLLILWLVITVVGSFHIKWNYHVESLNYNNYTKDNYVAITFDDGPNERFTPQVLSLLKKYNAKATFFCIGERVKQHPKVLKMIVDEGHVVGNHTYTHNENFGFFKTKYVISELYQANSIIKEIIGKEIKLFRPPFGVTNPRIKKAITKVGLQSIGWSIRSLDTTSKSTDSIVKSIKKTLKKGDVILLHDTSNKSIEVLEQLLVFMNEKQLESVSIPTLFNIEAYA
jgi:peptidoglycan/xylan/chitin deacetylase (PgdA/CDA1 family)